MLASESRCPLTSFACTENVYKSGGIIERRHKHTGSLFIILQCVIYKLCHLMSIYDVPKMNFQWLCWFDFRLYKGRNYMASLAK